MPSGCGRIHTSSRCITTCKGTIRQINVSRGGVPKRPIAEGLVTPLGIAGDLCAHPEFHGGPMQAVLLVAAEVVDELIARGYPVFPGALGENFTTEGLDRRLWRIGQRWRAGGCVIEFTKIRTPCGTLDVYGPAIKQEIYDDRVRAGDPGSACWGMSGFYARVVEPGPVAAGSPISLESEVA